MRYSANALFGSCSSRDLRSLSTHVWITSRDHASSFSSIEPAVELSVDVCCSSSSETPLGRGGRTRYETLSVFSTTLTSTPLGIEIPALSSVDAGLLSNCCRNEESDAARRTTSATCAIV